jgi:uracil-DNA glycosylase
MPILPSTPILSAFQRHVQRWGACQKCPLHRVRQKIVLAKGQVPTDVLLCGESPGLSEDSIGTPFVGPAGHLLDYILSRALENYPRVRVAVTNLVGCFPRMKVPKVVNLQKERYDVRVDRSTDWGNPYVIGKDGTREEVIQKYQEWLPRQTKLLKLLPQLTGARLGCFCHPLPCHGDVIVETWERLVDQGKVEPQPWAIEACRERLEEFIALANPRLVVAVGTLAAKHLNARALKGREFASIIHPAAV